MKVAIAGWGQEGQSAYKYYSTLYPNTEFIIFDEKHVDVPAAVQLVSGDNIFKKIDTSFDLIIRSPGIAPLRFKSEVKDKLWSATREFFRECKTPIIGVTGTKGKGTTSSLIYKILKSSGLKVSLAGNIGKPMLEILPETVSDDVVVLELSSFQLWDLTQSPHVAVVLMIEPDHLNVHKDFDDYINAKANIGRYQTSTDAMIYHPTNKNSAWIASQSVARKMHYMTSDAAHIEGDQIVMNEQKICSTNEVGLIGPHNLENICAAISAAWEFTQDISAIKRAITSFKGLPHRLEFVAEKVGIKFYDDSQATGVGSCVAALRSFEQPITLILGGSDKGVDMSELMTEIESREPFVVLIGQSADKLEMKLKNVNYDKYVNLGFKISMSQIVQESVKYTNKGSIVLLSPAHASFDMFESYQDRGNQFKKAVQDL
jgi:UDP-N-acetylmuramoylalanine--D-glutamate ligase